MFHGCEIQKKYNKAIREGRFREIQGDRRRCEEDSEDRTSRYGGDTRSRTDARKIRSNGKYIETREKIQENPWEIREDSEQGVHGRYKKIQYGMFTGETGRSVRSATGKDGEIQQGHKEI
jgi:hypothetical protein